MKKLLLLSIFALISTMQLKAQTTDSTQQSLEKEINTYESKDLVFIANARLMIAEAIKADDLKKAKTTFKFIVDKYDLSNYTPFAPTERIVLSLALEEYGTILTDISRGVSNLSINKGDKIIAYKNDGLFLIASTYLEKNKTALRNNIPAAERLQQEDKDLLELMYKSFDVEAETAKNKANAQSRLNNDADVFIELYPTSVYLPFVQQFIKEEYQDADAGLIMDFGVSRFNLSSKFYQYFDKKDTGLALGFSVPYKKMLFTLSANFIQNFTRTDMPLTVKGYYWEKDIKGSIVDIELGAGYNVLSSKRFQLYPYATLAYNAIVPMKQQERDLSMFRGDGIAVGAGAIFDYKFSIGKPKEAPNPYNPNYINVSRSNIGIRLKAMYMMPSIPIKELSQPYSYIAAGIFWEIRKMNRK